MGEGSKLYGYRHELFILLLFVFAWSLRANVNGLYLTHPGTIKAADPMYHVLAADIIVEEERYGYLAPYLAQGYNNMIDPNPPLNYLSTAALTKLSNLPPWIVMYLMVTLYEAFAVLMLYLIGSAIFKSKILGIITASLVIIPFGAIDWWYGMYIGLWNMVGGFFFFYASLWLAYEYWTRPERWKIFVLSLTVAGTWLVHIAELFITAFAIGFVGLRVLFSVKPFKEKIVHALLGGIVPLISIVLYYPRYRELSGFLTSGSSTPGEFFGWYYPKLAELPFFTSLSNFPWWILALAVLGTAQLLLNWRKYLPLLAAEAYLFTHLFVFAWFLSAYYFFVRQRMSLPFIIAPLAAYALYQFIIKPLYGLTKIKEWIIVGVALAAIFFIAWPQYTAVAQIKQQQHLTPEKYAAMVWIQENTPKDAEIFFVTGYYQMAGSFAKRVGFVLDLPELTRDVLPAFAQGNGTVNLTFDKMGSNGDTEMAHSAIDTGSFFTYGRGERRYGKMNITDFEYAVFTDFNLGETQIIPVYNRLLMNGLKELNWTLVYDNAGIRIMKSGEL